MRGFPSKYHCVSNDESQPTECEQTFDRALLIFNIIIRPIFIALALGVGYLVEWVKF